MLIRGIYYEAYHPAKSPPSTVRSRAEFLDVINDELSDIRPINVEDACRTVFDCMRRHITRSQLEKVFWSLPEGVRQLFGSMETVGGGA
jgi:uncharacterized protein (DUF2267 family)